MMRNVTVFFVVLVILSTLLIAGCAQQVPKTTPTPTPAGTAVPTVVQNQGGVAIFKTLPPTTMPAVTNVTNQTITGNVTNQTPAAK